ncbi:phage holin family protein [Phytoactinopolyspora mesophila]
MTESGNTRQREESAAQLVADMSEQTSRLVRDEIRLAVAELREKPKYAGLGLGLFGSAGLFAFFGTAVLITAAILALDLAVPAWAAALIVAAVLFVLALIAALVGKREIQQAKPMPERAAENVRRDIEEITGRGTS